VYDRIKRAAGGCAAATVVLVCIIPWGTQAEDVPTLAPLIDKVAPGVVKIEITGRSEQQPPPAGVVLSQRPMPSGDSAAPRSAGARNPARRRKSAESGIIFDANDGLIVVNHHLIADAGRIVVCLNDGRRLRATPVGTDPDTDVALIRVPAENLTAVPLSDSDKVSVGDYAIAIGYPFDVGQTVTLGIVSALHRSDLSLGPYEEFIQTDAPANPGDAGGALLNLRGELIGLNAVVYDNGPNIGIAFAIPANTVGAVANEIAKYGEVRHPSLGIAVADLTPDLARERRLNAYQTGALIAAVNSGSAAQDAGLEEGDVVTAIGATPVRNSADLRNKILHLGIGETVDVNVLRNGNQISIRATLVAREVPSR
jgi:serine protease Do/serine protease DegQ